MVICVFNIFQVWIFQALLHIFPHLNKFYKILYTASNLLHSEFHLLPFGFLFRQSWAKTNRYKHSFFPGLSVWAHSKMTISGFIRLKFWKSVSWSARHNFQTWIIFTLESTDLCYCITKHFCNHRFRITLYCDMQPYLFWVFQLQIIYSLQKMSF